MNKMLSIAIAAALLAATVMTAGPASAATVSKSDPHPECSQAAPLDVKRATFTYSKKAFKTRIKMGDLSKKHTRVLTRMDISTSTSQTYSVVLSTWFTKDRKLRTVGYWSDYEAEDYDNRFTKGVKAVWNWDKNVVTFRLTKHLRGKKVSAAAYSVAKGELHGPVCGDWIFVRSLKRG